MNSPTSLSIIHLVRKGNTENLLKSFIRSYLRFTADHPHTLIFILKGFDKHITADIKRRILIDLADAEFIEIDDDGYDINAYRIAAQRIASQFLIFTNSYSEFEGNNWARKLIQPFEDGSNTGITGATGSWESISPAAPFPNAHIRTNAFAVRRTEFLSLDFGPLDSKWACREFEAGENSMTRQFEARGQQAYVVGRNGTAYGKEDWPDANVFRWGRQSNLLVSDNQTRAYFNATFYWRRKQSRASWHAKANPFRTSIAEKFKRLLWRSSWQQAWRRLTK